MSPVFIPPAIITDPAILAANAKALLASELPGWQSSPGNVLDLLIDAFSFPAGEQGEVLLAQLVAQYRSLGPLMSTPPKEGAPARTLATITFTGEAGYTIEAGQLVVGIRDSDNELRGFRLTANLVVAAGKLTETVTLEAEEAGTASNGLTGEAELITAPASVSKVTLATSGEGEEPESEEDFLDRLTENLAIQKPGPVLAADAAVLARNVAGVYRACAVNLLKPAEAESEVVANEPATGAESSTEEKCVTVACTDTLGKASSKAVREAVLAALAAKREPNLRWFIVKPHYWKISVTTTVFMWPGENKATVEAAVKATLEEVLSPAKWATDATGRPQRWANDPVIRQSELYAAISKTFGVRYCSAVTFAKEGAGLGTADVTIESGSKIPALPEPGVLTITATATT